MLSFSDVKRYITDSPAMLRFKPWWEISLDVMLAGLFLIMILSWSRSISVEAGGLICVPMYGDSYGFATSDARYIQSRCHMESSARNIEFYPYMLFVQWLLIFLCQITWVWIPAVVTKFTAFNDIFRDILAVEPIFQHQPHTQRMLPQIDYTTENKEKLKIIHDKLIFILMDRNYIRKVYMRKVFSLTFLLLLCMATNIIWFLLSNFLQSNFPCSLGQKKSAKIYFPVACNLSPYLFIYGIMLIHSLIIGIMLLLSFYSIYWYLMLSKMEQKTSDAFFSDNEDNYKGLPGYYDLKIVLELILLNLRDGNFTWSVLSYVLAGKYTDIGPQTSSSVVAREEKLSFSQERLIVEHMLNSLGLKILPNDQSTNHLNDCFAILRRSRNLLDLNFIGSIRDEIKNEIDRQSVYFDNLKSSSSQKNKDFIVAEYLKSKLEEIEHNVGWPDHLTLLLAASALKLNIILVTAYSPVEEDLNTLELFETVGAGPPEAYVIMAYVSPHYYYLTEEIHTDSSEKEQKRNKYILSQKYREKVRQNSIKWYKNFIKSKEEKRHGNVDKRTKMNDFFAIANYTTYGQSDTRAKFHEFSITRKELIPSEKNVCIPLVQDIDNIKIKTKLCDSRFSVSPALVSSGVSINRKL